MVLSRDPRIFQLLMVRSMQTRNLKSLLRLIVSGFGGVSLSRTAWGLVFEYSASSLPSAFHSDVFNSPFVTFVSLV